jgi:hypothetical protein
VAGCPIGSGVEESVNKLLMEARLLGAGVHWEHTNFNPLFALRNAACNEWWDESRAASSLG